MTNKLPEVGKRYIDKNKEKIMEVTRVTTYINFSGKRLANKTRKMYCDCIEVEDLWENWEELPDSHWKKGRKL